MLLSFKNCRIAVSRCGLYDKISHSEPVIPQLDRWWAYNLQSVRMCWTVVRVPQLLHIGGDDLLNRYEWVRRVCPIRSRVKVRCSEAHLRSGYFMGEHFTCLSCDTLWRHSSSHTDQILRLMFLMRSWAGNAMSSFCLLRACLAKLSARSFPAIPQWPGIQQNVMLRLRETLSMDWIHGCLEWPLCRASRQLAESVKIIVLWCSLAIVAAVMRAWASAENTLQASGSA